MTFLIVCITTTKLSISVYGPFISHLSTYTRLITQIDAEENTIITSQLVEYVIKAHGDKNPVVIPSMSYMKLAPSCSGGKWKFIDFRVYFDTSPIFKKVMTTSS